MSAPVVLARNSVLTIDGDSINDPTLPYGSFNGLLVAIDSFYMPPGGGSFRRPIHRNYSTTGATTTTLNGRKAEVGDNATTHYFAQCGINDVQLAVPLATSIANVTAIMTFMSGLGIRVLWVGPLCFGELWPAGANAADAAIAAWDAAIAPIVNAVAGCAYVRARDIYTAEEPVLNLPGPPGAISGILCVPAAAPGGIHPNPTGNSFFPALELASLSLT